MVSHKHRRVWTCPDKSTFVEDHIPRALRVLEAAPAQAQPSRSAAEPEITVAAWMPVSRRRETPRPITRPSRARPANVATSFRSVAAPSPLARPICSVCPSFCLHTRISGPLRYCRVPVPPLPQETNTSEDKCVNGTITLKFSFGPKSEELDWWPSCWVCRKWHRLE